MAALRPVSYVMTRVPEHTGGLDARPAEYEQRVIGFFDRALLNGSLATE